MTKVIVLNEKTSDVDSEVVQITKVDRNKVLIKQNKEVGIGIIDFEEKTKKGTKIGRLLENQIEQKLEIDYVRVPIQI